MRIIVAILFFILFLQPCFSQNEYQDLISVYAPRNNLQLVSWLYLIDEGNSGARISGGILFDISNFDKNGKLKTYKYQFNYNDTSKFNIRSFEDKFDSINTKTVTTYKRMESYRLYQTPPKYDLPPESVECKYKDSLLQSRTTFYWHSSKRGHKKTEEFHYNKRNYVNEVVIYEDGKKKRYYAFSYSYSK